MARSPAFECNQVPQTAASSTVEPWAIRDPMIPARTSPIPADAIPEFPWSHNKRSEHWTVINGAPIVTNGNNKTTLMKNESIYIPKNAKHRIEIPNDGIVEIIEVQVGDYIEEDDIIRYEDQYNRTSDD